MRAQRTEDAADGSDGPRQRRGEADPVLEAEDQPDGSNRERDVRSGVSRIEGGHRASRTPHADKARTISTPREQRSQIVAEQAAEFDRICERFV